MKQHNNNRNRSQIDSAAVSYLKLAIDFGKTKAYIRDNDKTAVWDGEIFLFGDEKHTNTDVKKVPVQVKGTTNGNINDNIIKHSVSRDELRNYGNDGGVVFFVILIKYKENIEQRKIFYRIFLPQDVKPILESFNPTKKTKSFEFQEIKTNDLWMVMNHFLANRIINRPIYNFDVLMQTNKMIIKGFIKKSEISSKISTFKQLNTILNHKNTYIYAVPKEFPNERFPIEKACEEMQAIVSRDVYENPIFNGKTYNVINTQVISKETIKYYIGAHSSPFNRSIFINYNEKHPLNSQITIDLKGTINQRLIDLEFAIEILKMKNDEIELVYKNLIAKRKLFDEIGLNHDIDIIKLTDNDYEILKLIEYGINDGIELKSSNSLQTIEVAEYKCLFYISPLKDTKYKLLNPYKNHITFPVQEREKDSGYIIDSLTIPLFFIREKCLFYKYSNTDYNAIYEILTSMEITPYLIKYALNIQLKMIEAFDDNHADNEVLELALRFGEWLKDKTNIDKDYLTINRIQILSRMEKIQSSDYVELGAFTKSSNNGLRFATYVLLKDKKNASKELEEMDVELRSDFEKFPIYTLFKNI